MILRINPVRHQFLKYRKFEKANTNQYIENKADKNNASLPYFKGIESFGLYKPNAALGEIKAQETFNLMIEDFKKLPQVQAIALGGSRQTGVSDKFSDSDIEIYTDGEIPEEIRQKIVQKYSSHYDVGQDYFGPCDEFYVNGLGQFDIAYFDKKWMDETVENVWLKHNASNGYTTCFLHTIKNSEPVYDKDGWLQAKKDILNTPYPQELKENIIKRNMQLLKKKSFDSYSQQVRKAVSRKDYVSLNHRIAAFMASYFDIIFAMNEVLHPGEKRLVQFAKEKCKILPNDFEENINSLTKRPMENTNIIIDDMVRELEKCLNANS